jgi:thiol:disulfide interchange protein
MITLAYAIGTALPMGMIMIGGQQLLKKVPWLLQHIELIQRLFGVLMILTAIAIYFSFDRVFQQYILDTFPSYTDYLTGWESHPVIDNLLRR